MQPSGDETHLVRKAAACDDDAFAALCARYRRLLYNIAAKFTTSPDDRDDLRSEIITRLYENQKRALRAWRPVAPFAAYLTTIASRHCLLVTRRQARLQTTALVAGDEQSGEPFDLLERMIPGDEADEPGSALERSEMRLALTRAVAELNDVERLILTLRFQDGLDGPTMASLLGLSHGAVRQRLFKTIRKLEAILEQQHPGLFDPPSRKERANR